MRKLHAVITAVIATVVVVAVLRRRGRHGRRCVFLKTLVHLTLPSKRYETRLKRTVGDYNVLLFCEVHSFEIRCCKHIALSSSSPTLSSRQQKLPSLSTYSEVHSFEKQP